MIKLNKETKVDCDNDVRKAFLIWKYNNDNQTMPLHRYIFLHNYPDNNTIEQKTFKIDKNVYVPIKLNCELSYESLKTVFSLIADETQINIGRVCIYRDIDGTCDLKIIELNKQLNITISLYIDVDNNISKKIYIRLGRSVNISKIKEYNSIITLKHSKCDIKLLMGLVTATYILRGNASNNVKKYIIEKLNKLHKENNNIFNIRSLSELIMMKNINMKNCSFTIKIYKPHYKFDYETRSHVRINKITEHVYQTYETHHLIELEFKKRKNSTDHNYSDYLLEKTANIKIGKDYICRIRVS